MNILKIKINADGYECTNEAVIADGESVPEFIDNNIITEMNKPRYAGHEIQVSVFVLEVLSENSLIPLVIAAYFLRRSAFRDNTEILSKWQMEQIQT